MTVQKPESTLVASELPLDSLPKAVAPQPRRSNKFASACGMLASMTTIILGYDIGVMSGAAIFIQDDLHVSDTQIEILLGILNVSSLIGSLAAGRTADWIGRRYTIFFAAVNFFVCAIMMGLAPNYAFLMVGRFIAGISVGYAGVGAAVYIAEIAPASSRGFLASFLEVFINFGILVGYVSNFAFAKLPENLGWRFMLGVGAIPCVFLGVGVLAMPESPRWLVLQGQLGMAKKVLAKTSDTPEEAEERLLDIKNAAGIPADCNDDVVTVQKQSHGKGVWKELFLRPTPSVRRVLISAIGIEFFQQASGIASVVLYSPRVFKKAGLHEKDKLLGTTVAVGFTKTLFILVATFLIDRVGRRPLLLSSTGGMIVSLSGLGLGLTIIDHHPNGQLPWAIGLCILSILTFVAFFSIGLGPINSVYCSEIFPLRLRAQGVSAGVVANRVTSGVITMTFISLYKAITIGGCFFLFAGIAAVAWVFFFTYLKETKGKTLEEIEILFGKKTDDKKDGEVQMVNGAEGGSNRKD